MRTMTLMDIQKIAKRTDLRVERVINAYNSKPSNKEYLAIKGGTRRPRSENEERVLARFVCK